MAICACVLRVCVCLQAVFYDNVSLKGHENQLAKLFRSRLVGRRHGDVSTTAFPRDRFRVPIVTVRAAATAKWAHRTCLAFDLERSFWWCCTHQSDGERVVTASPLNGVSYGAWCLESSGAPTTKVHIASSLPTTRRNSSHKITFCKWVAPGTR